LKKRPKDCRKDQKGQILMKSPKYLKKRPKNEEKTKRTKQIVSVLKNFNQFKN
jgi:hypothetical protein